MGRKSKNKMRVTEICVAPVAITDVPHTNSKAAHRSVFLRAQIEMRTHTNCVGPAETSSGKRSSDRRDKTTKECVFPTDMRHWPPIRHIRREASGKYEMERMRWCN